MDIFGTKKPTTPSDDENRLVQLCEIVTLGLKNFQRVGTALEEIRDRQLYRLTHKTFGDFCLTQWNMTEPYATRLIAAAEICRSLGDNAHVIENERQARDLRQLEPEQRTAVVAEAIATQKPLSQVIRKTMPMGKKGLKPIRLRLPGCTLVIEPNKKFQGLEQTLLFAIEKLRSEQAA